ncbi:MAG: hypothetical protein JNM56_24140 [Planctomycetia bacterium]|nr:hypothetical protein [Planctomycetia bacterium]
MAPNPKPSGLRSRVHFLFRLLGLAGLAVTLIGLQILFIVSGTISLETLRETATVWQERFQSGVFAGDDSLAFVAASLVVGGTLVLLVVLLLDALIFLRQVTALRTAAGLNLVVQVGLATALLVGINYFSFRNYARFDWTRNQQFTLPLDIENQLKQLQGQTTIVVYLPHQSLGQRTQNLDPETRAYISATEHQVVEKLKDAVAQFREFGQRFEVVVLDVEDWQHFKTKLDAVTKDHPELREAINQTPDNTIFFAGQGRVQRLSFNEFYQLDLVASKEQGNLVLVSQGVRPLARKVFHIDEKQPRIAIGVIHDILSTEGPGDYGMRGVKKALSSRGFDTRDVILKKSRGFSLVGPGVYTFAEGRYDRLSSELAILNRNLQTIESFRKRNLDIKNDFEKLPLPELNEKYARRLQVREITPQMKQLQLEELNEVLAEQQEAINDFTARRDTKAKELAAIQVDDVAEMQRMSDLQGKMNRLLADCDLLIIPRMTYRNMNLGEVFSNRIHQLEDAQVEAIKQFLKAGKPVLACLGPSVEAQPGARPPDAGGADNLEKLLGELGLQFGNSVVLYDVEAASFAGQERNSEQVLGANVEVPPVEFDWKAGDRWPPAWLSGSALKPNPLRSSMYLAERGAGKSLDLRLRHPRPVYFEPANATLLALPPALSVNPLPANWAFALAWTQSQPVHAATFMTTNSAAWNEDQPFPSDDRGPRFEEPKPNDPNRGTRDEKRHGRQSIGVAAEPRLPASWFSGEAGTHPDKVRVAAIGHGHLFVGEDLSPAKEKLLLDVCNWLLGRDDHIVQAGDTWQYPRVELSKRDRELWRWGALLNLPGVFLFLGMVVWLVRGQR